MAYRRLVSTPASVRECAGWRGRTPVENTSPISICRNDWSLPRISDRDATCVKDVGLHPGLNYEGSNDKRCQTEWGCAWAADSREALLLGETEAWHGPCLGVTLMIFFFFQGCGVYFNQLGYQGYFWTILDNCLKLLFIFPVYNPSFVVITKKY